MTVSKSDTKGQGKPWVPSSATGFVAKKWGWPDWWGLGVFVNGCMKQKLSLSMDWWEYEINTTGSSTSMNIKSRHIFNPLDWLMRAVDKPSKKGGFDPHNCPLLLMKHTSHHQHNDWYRMANMERYNILLDLDMQQVVYHNRWKLPILHKVSQRQRQHFWRIFVSKECMHYLQFKIMVQFNSTPSSNLTLIK